MPFPCSLMWCYHKVRIGLCKGGDERNSRCQKKDWQIPGPPTRAGKVFTSDSWERLTIGTSRHTITIRSISETLEGNLLGKKNLPCVDSERQPGELVLQSHKSTKIPKKLPFFSSSATPELSSSATPELNGSNVSTLQVSHQLRPPQHKTFKKKTSSEQTRLNSYRKKIPKRDATSRNTLVYQK